MKAQLIFKFGSPKSAEVKSVMTSLTSMLGGNSSSASPPATMTVRVVKVSYLHVINLNFVRSKLNFCDGKEEDHDKFGSMSEKCKEALEFIYKAKTFVAKKGGIGCEKSMFDNLKHKIVHMQKEVSTKNIKYEPASPTVRTGIIESGASKESPVRRGSAKDLIGKIEDDFAVLREKEKRSDHKLIFEKKDYHYYQWKSLSKRKSNVAILLLSDWTSDHSKFLEMQKEMQLIDTLRKSGRVFLLSWPFDKSNKTTAKEGDEEILSNKSIVNIVLALIKKLRRRSDSKIDFVIPLSLKHAGWIALRLRKRLPRLIPAVIFLQWTLDDPSPKDLKSLESFGSSKSEEEFEASKAVLAYCDKNDKDLNRWASIAAQLSASYKEYASPATELNCIAKTASGAIGLQELNVLQISIDDEEDSVRENPEASSPFPWLHKSNVALNSLNARIADFLTKHVVLPPVPPLKPKWDGKTGRMTWSTCAQKNEDMKSKLHFFLLPEAKTAEGELAVMQEFNAAIDEGRLPDVNNLKKAASLVGGSAAVAGAAWLVSLSVASGLTVAVGAGYLAKRAIFGRDATKTAIVPDITVDARLRKSGQAEHFLLEKTAQTFLGNKSTGLFKAGRHYAVCATCETAKGLSSAFGDRIMWRCPAASMDNIQIANIDGNRIVWGAPKKSEVLNIYEVCYSTTSTLDSWKYSLSEAGSSSLSLDALDPSYEHVAQVRAISVGGPGDWSEKRKFRITSAAEKNASTVEDDGKETVAASKASTKAVDEGSAATSSETATKKKKKKRTLPKRKLSKSDSHWRKDKTKGSDSPVSKTNDQGPKTEISGPADKSALSDDAAKPTAISDSPTPEQKKEAIPKMKSKSPEKDGHWRVASPKKVTPKKKLRKRSSSKFKSKSPKDDGHWRKVKRDTTE
eukprot:g1105.t1